MHQKVNVGVSRSRTYWASGPSNAVDRKPGAAVKGMTSPTFVVRTSAIITQQPDSVYGAGQPDEIFLLQLEPF
jgi:hypothetical protein